MELEPVVGAVVELGEHLGIHMPHTRPVYACPKLHEKGKFRSEGATMMERDSGHMRPRRISGYTNFLYRNNGDGTFIEVREKNPHSEA
jgi:hypothetical protein